MMPVPRVMVKNSPRKPMSARDAIRNSRRIVPTVVICMERISARRLPNA